MSDNRLISGLTGLTAANHVLNRLFKIALKVNIVLFKLKFRSDSTRQQRVTDTGRGVSRDSRVGLGFEASSDHSIVCRVH